MDDGGPLTLNGLPSNVVRCVSYTTNVGKGDALRTGFEMAHGRYIGFIDADGDISPEYLGSFVSLMRAEAPDIIIGSKRHPSPRCTGPCCGGSTLGRTSISSLLFKLSVADTQVGVKLLDRRVVADVLPLLRESRFALDVELLVLAKRFGYEHRGKALRIQERTGSTVSLKRAWRLLLDTLKLFLRLSVRHEYHAAIAARSGRHLRGSGASNRDQLVGSRREPGTGLILLPRTPPRTYLTNRCFTLAMPFGVGASAVEGDEVGPIGFNRGLVDGWTPSYLP